MLTIMSFISPEVSWDSGIERKFGQAWVRKRRCWLLTSRESSAFTIQQSVQVATTKNPVEKKAKKQAAYWRRSLILASSLSGRDTWAAASSGPTQVAGTLSGFWASATWECENTRLLLFLTPHCRRLKLWSECEQAVTHRGVLEVIIQSTQPPIRSQVSQSAECVLGWGEKETW